MGGGEKKSVDKIFKLVDENVMKFLKEFRKDLEVHYYSY